MERPEHNVIESATQRSGNAESARLLLVGGDGTSEADLINLLRRRRHECTHVRRLDEARDALAENRYDLILLNRSLPDGDGLDLAAFVQKESPATKAIVFSETGSFKSALQAMRCGVIDCITTPVDPDELADRIDAALHRSRAERRRELNIRKLQSICQELNIAHTEIAEQVDSLCNDLAAAYQELTEQVDEIALATEFRTLVRQELDVEELLRTTLEYLLTKTGPTNAAVFLPDADQHYSLGAYVNYDCPRASVDHLLAHLCDAICPQMSQEPEIVAFDDAREFAEWIGADGESLTDSQVIALSCIHEDDCLAVLVLFRNRDKPFEATLGTTLDIIRAAFAEQLARIIHVHHRARPQWPRDADDYDDFDDEYGFGYEGGLAA
ncbi:MAG: response regulator [Planctomycetota bacterium]|nr:response regulator [Planctomycetota bacterium]